MYLSKKTENIFLKEKTKVRNIFPFNKLTFNSFKLNLEENYTFIWPELLVTSVK